MTLPHGFGSDKCIVYNCDGFKNSYGGCDNPSCSNYKKSSIPLSYRFSVWKRRNSELFTFLMVTTFMASLLVIVVFTTVYSQTVSDDLKIIIEGSNCSQLAEYVADKKDHYEYADHRYEWLCVNEQVKEFQG